MNLDFEEMSREALEECLAELEARLCALDAQEPENMMSEAYEAWGEEHEELEDLIEECQEFLEAAGA